MKLFIFLFWFGEPNYYLYIGEDETEAYWNIRKKMIELHGYDDSRIELYSEDEIKPGFIREIEY